MEFLFTSQLFTCDDYLFRRSFFFWVQFYNAPVNEYQAKLVLKPLTPEWKWKIIYEPLHQDVRVLSKKIPITKFLNLQVEWCLCFFFMTLLLYLFLSLLKMFKIVLNVSFFMCLYILIPTFLLLMS